MKYIITALLLVVLGCGRNKEEEQCSEVNISEFPEDDDPRWSMQGVWLTKADPFRRRVECAELPAFGVYATKPGDHQIDEIQVVIVDYYDQTWIESLPDAGLSITVNGERIGTFDPAGFGSNTYGLGAEWDVVISDLDIFVSPESPVTFQFVLVAWQNEEILAGIEDLWDKEKDKLQISAIAAGYGCCYGGQSRAMYLIPPD